MATYSVFGYDLGLQMNAMAAPPAAGKGEADRASPSAESLASSLYGLMGRPGSPFSSAVSSHSDLNAAAGEGEEEGEGEGEDQTAAEKERRRRPRGCRGGRRNRARAAAAAAREDERASRWGLQNVILPSDVSVPSDTLRATQGGNTFGTTPVLAIPPAPELPAAPYGRPTSVSASAAAPHPHPHPHTSHFNMASSAPAPQNRIALAASASARMLSPPAPLAPPRPLPLALSGPSPYLMAAPLLNLQSYNPSHGFLGHNMLRAAPPAPPAPQNHAALGYQALLLEAVARERALINLLARTQY